MKHVESAGGIVLSPYSQILVVTNRTGSITLPKGTMKKGEEPIDTARREILEESGLGQLEIYRELGIIVRPGRTAENAVSPSVIKHIHIFLASTVEVELSPAADDVQKAEWIEQDSVTSQLSHREEAEFFELYRTGSL